MTSGFGRGLRAFWLLGLLTGCAAIIGVPDLTFDADAPQGTPDGSTSADGSTLADGGGTSTEDATTPCDTTQLQTDPRHCGRCGHDCLEGECVDGQCKAFQISAVGNAPLHAIVEHGSALYVSAAIREDSTMEGGIWKVPKTSGNPVRYVPNRYAEEMAVLGNTLYFVVNDYKHDADAGTEGGLWSCDLDGPTPCVPKLVAPAEQPTTVAVDDGAVFYADDDQGVMKYAPPAAPAVFRAGWSPFRMWVDGEDVFYVASPGLGANTKGSLFEILHDASDIVELSAYAKPNVARGGDITGGPTSIHFTAFDLRTSTGGVVRRVSRPRTAGVPPCDYGGDGNKRPYGVYVDETRVYWANQGNPDAPYEDGSIAYCELDGCCSTPTVPWTGTGEPVRITGDATAIYWVTYRTGAVWKMAKP